jgi:hypothetical protein
MYLLLLLWAYIFPYKQKQHPNLDGHVDYNEQRFLLLRFFFFLLTACPVYSSYFFLIINWARGIEKGRL